MIGYGLDFAERYRNLPFVGVLRDELAAQAEELRVTKYSSIKLAGAE